jgi:hypothetical protein
VSNDCDEMRRLTTLTDAPKIAPFESCIACFKGDTRTAVLLEGEAEWHIAALMHWAGLDQETATATFQVYAEQNLGCDPGMVPSGRVENGFRLCRDCARKTGVEVSEVVPGTVGHVYVQP